MSRQKRGARHYLVARIDGQKVSIIPNEESVQTNHIQQWKQKWETASIEVELLIEDQVPFELLEMPF